MDQNCEKVRGLLCHPLQGITQYKPGRPPVHHNIQRVSGRCHSTLGDGGGSDEGGRVWNRRRGAGTYCVFFRGQRTSIVALGGEAVDVVDALTDLFYRFGTNMRKKMSMA